MSELPDWWQEQELVLRQQYEKEKRERQAYAGIECCEHGMPIDCGRVCPECAVNNAAEPDPISSEWHEEYNQYLQEQESKDERSSAG